MAYFIFGLAGFTAGAWLAWALLKSATTGNVFEEAIGIAMLVFTVIPVGLVVVSKILEWMETWWPALDLSAGSNIGFPTMLATSGCTVVVIIGVVIWRRYSPAKD